MARMLRLEYPAAMCHVTARGNERKDLFRSDADRLRFLEKLAESVRAHHIRLYAYVLMSNHFHEQLNENRILRRTYERIVEALNH